MSIPYRTQQNIKRAAVTLLVLLVVGSLLWGLWFLWLQRYVIYTREGAVIDFALSETLAPGQVATPPEDSMEVEIHYNEGDDMVSISKELTQLKGYYITAEDLTADPALVWEQVQILPANTPIMLDMKSIYGEFYYSTGLGRPISSSVNVAAVEELLSNLKGKGYYTIARVPALRDRAYGLEDPTNIDRMQRQKQYLEALYERARQCMAADEDFVSQAALTMTDYLVSDCSGNKLETIYSPEGRSVAGEQFMEFYPDAASLERIVIDCFYEKEE